MDILSAWYAVTLLGTPEYWAYASAGLFLVYFILRHFTPNNPIWKKHKPFLKGLLIILIPSLFIFLGSAFLLKTFWFVQRPCIICTGEGLPVGCNPYCLSDSSFPSGHAGTIFTAFASLYLATRRRAALALLPIPLLVSYSRMALGVHTLTDVLAGTLIGLSITILVSVMLRKWQK